MNKRVLIKKIATKLTSELEVYFRAAQASRAGPTHEHRDGTVSPPVRA